MWKGEFGRAYNERNTLDVDALNALWRDRYGVSRAELNAEFLATIPMHASFLEVGCNVGNQLLLLRETGYSNLSGVELQPAAAELAKVRVPEASIQQGSAFALPFDDETFDIVFTSAVLIHISPSDLPRAL